jgi:DNA-binding CsgD family transcriptional regulator
MDENARLAFPTVSERPISAAANGIDRDPLTARELEILRFTTLGFTSVEIARKLTLSPRTVETHRAHIHSKLGLATRAELVHYALGRGLLSA